MSDAGKAVLLDRIEAGDVAGTVAFLEGLSESERAALSKDVTRAYKALWGRQFGDAPPPEGAEEAARLAVLGAGRLSDIKRMRTPLHIREEAHFRMLSTRPRAFVQQLADWLSQETPWLANLVLDLMARGLCDQPSHDEFLLGLISAYGSATEEDGGLAGTLRDRPDFLQRDLWRLLAVEGSGEFSLAAHDKYAGPHNAWGAALIALAADGVVSRERLLDATLESLGRDFAAFRAGWFSRLHVALDPTTEEMHARSEAYLRLLGSAVSSTVTFALRALTALQRAEKLDPEAVLQHVSPALHARTQSATRTALALTAAAGADSRLRPEAARLIASAAIHDAPAIQERVLTLLEGLDAVALPQVRAALDDVRDILSPSVRKRLDALSGESEPKPDDTATALDQSDDSGSDPDDLERQRIDPIRDLDDLILRFARILEAPEEVDTVEQVLGGLARLADARPADFDERTRPLAKRAGTVRKRTQERYDAIGHDLACLALSWTDGVPFAPELPAEEAHDSHSTARLFRLHVEALAEQLRRAVAAPLLSTPTHPRGWVEPAELVERLRTLRAAGRSPSAADAVLGLLRLGHDGRADALAAAARLDGELGHATRYALGADGVDVGSSAHLWIAAARARDATGQHPLLLERFPDLGPDGIEPGHCSFHVENHGGDDYDWYRIHLTRTPPPPPSVPALHPTVLFHRTESGRFARYSGSGACGYHPAQVRWSATIAPGCLEGYFSVGADRLDLDWTEVRWEVVHFLEPLLEPDVPLGPNALLLLTLGLGAREAGQSGLAVDAFIAGAESDRLDADRLGACMGQLLGTGMIKARRWGDALHVAAGSSPRAAAAARVAMQGALRGDAASHPKDLSRFLEVLHELLVDARTRIDDAEARTYLSAVPTGGKTGKLVRALLAL